MARARNVSHQTQTLLAALVADPQAWRHGYELSQVTGLKSGTLYPLLIRLNDQGFLMSEWRPAEQGGKPPRHLYRLTASGLALACSHSVRPKSAPFARLPDGKLA